MQSTPEALDLARIQFAFTVSFHIIFPALSIGARELHRGTRRRLAQNRQAGLQGTLSLLVEGLRRRVRHGRRLGRCHGIRIRIRHQLGRLLELRRSDHRSLADLRSHDRVLSRSDFLGIILFGWNKVGPKAHFGATLMVAIGTIISTFWILASNSWIQTPQGFRIEGDHVVPVDWWAIIFNPSFPYRLATWRSRRSSSGRWWSRQRAHGIC